MWRSITRAKFITLDLIKKGIDKSRLSYEGRGDSEPVVFGSTDEEQSLNRRIEIKLIKSNHL
jgi:outer membrane protein OmpA-like peptidoglycan-associated protein